MILLIMQNMYISIYQIRNIAVRMYVYGYIVSLPPRIYLNM